MRIEITCFFVYYITIKNSKQHRPGRIREKGKIMKYIIWHDNGKAGQKGYSEFNSEKEKNDFVEEAEGHNIFIYEIAEIK